MLLSRAHVQVRPCSDLNNSCLTSFVCLFCFFFSQYVQFSALLCSLGLALLSTHKEREGWLLCLLERAGCCVVSFSLILYVSVCFPVIGNL